MTIEEKKERQRLHVRRSYYRKLVRAASLVRLVCCFWW